MPMPTPSGMLGLGFLWWVDFLVIGAVKAEGGNLTGIIRLGLVLDGGSDSAFAVGPGVWDWLGSGLCRAASAEAEPPDAGGAD